MLKETEKEFLKGYDQSKYERPSVTADSVTLTVRRGERRSFRYDPENKLRLLLIRRKNHPYKGCWALPGGFLEPGESIEECVLRELYEETGAKPSALFPLGMYSKPGRDPRGWIISEAFVTVIRGDTEVRGGDDAEDARWFDVSFFKDGNGRRKFRLEDGETVITPDEGESDSLAFDHARIISDALSMIAERVRHGGHIYEFMPDKFTFAELQASYEALTGETEQNSNFRRKMSAQVEPTGQFTSGAGHRPAELYRRKDKETDL